jgi:predicted component of type VI protein secretion system
LTKADRSEELEGLIEQVLENTDTLKQMAEDLRVSESGKPAKGDDQ